MVQLLGTPFTVEITETNGESKICDVLIGTGIFYDNFVDYLEILRCKYNFKY